MRRSSKRPQHVRPPSLHAHDITVPPTAGPGERLDSWLEKLARRTANARRLSMLTAGGTLAVIGALALGFLPGTSGADGQLVLLIVHSLLAVCAGAAMDAASKAWRMLALARYPGHEQTGRQYTPSVVAAGFLAAISLLINATMMVSRIL